MLGQRLIADYFELVKKKKKKKKEAWSKNKKKKKKKGEFDWNENG